MLGAMSKLKRGKRTGLAYFSYADIKSWSPCYDLVRHIPVTWRGTALGILALTEVPPQDRLWVVCREEIVSARTLRLFAVWCARQALALVPNPDPRSIAACDVAERFANGEATKAERAAAGVAAWAAARAAAGAAARDAAWAAAWAAARDAAWAAAWAAARAAARAAAEAAQCAKLAEMVRAEGLAHVDGGA